MSNLLEPYKDHIPAYAHFKYSEDQDEALKALRDEFPSFVAKRLLNDFKGILNKAKIEPVDIPKVIHSEEFSFLCFLMKGKAIDKKQFASILEQYVNLYQESIITPPEDENFNY